MFYRRFTFLLLLRIVFLLVTVLIIAWIFGNPELFFSQVILAIVLVLQITDLVRFVNHTNRELARLFVAIRHGDFSATFREPALGKSFSELQESMTGIIQAYKDVKIEKEAQYHFLQMMISQLHIGIISVDDTQSIILTNTIAETIAHSKGVKNWKMVQQLNPAFAQPVDNIGDNGRKLLELGAEGEKKFYAVDVRTLRILDKSQKLITFQDVNSEIEQKEMEAWHKLIRILTHEIMNSVTPISSLTETMQTLLEDKSGKAIQSSQLNDDTLNDVLFSIKTIHRRSEGLLNFVEDYRKLTKVPQPVLQDADITTLLLQVRQLMAPELEKRSITLSVQSPLSFVIKIDPTLVEQVLINLITNSRHALENRNDGIIELTSEDNGQQVVVSVRDNGKGIPARELEQIFVPFFSTRKNGSGIGLSLSKQIMSLHGGTIKVSSREGEGTTFFLTFKKA